nr:CDP-alcohol phosphatidyltransferase family protein [Pseudomarimonas arenosa]
MTFLRLLLAPMIFYWLWQGEFGQAAGWLLAAVFSDLLDGYLARRFRWQSELGGMLDPLADKLLMGLCFIGLTLAEQVPLWLLVFVLARDVVIVTGALAYRFLIGPFAAEPRWLGKSSTLVQSSFVLVTVFALGWNWPLSPWLDYAVWTVAAAALLSGADYVWHWSWRAWQAGGGRNQRNGRA